MRSLLLAIALLFSACTTTTTKISPLGATIDEQLQRMVPFGLSGSVLVADRSGIILNQGYGDR